MRKLRKIILVFLIFISFVAFSEISKEKANEYLMNVDSLNKNEIRELVQYLTTFKTEVQTAAINYQFDQKRYFFGIHEQVLLTGLVVSLANKNEQASAAFLLLVALHGIFK